MSRKNGIATVPLYEMMELSFRGEAPDGNEVNADLTAEFVKDGKVTRVKGFYAGNRSYKVRFLPMETGKYAWRITGTAIPATQQGELEVTPGSAHGPVQAEGTHLVYADGTRFDSFGTTVYALAHQSDALIEETMKTLETSPFNKLRTCVFPKHYLYNFNEPALYPFHVRDDLARKDFHAQTAPIVFPALEERDRYWDVSRPDYDFWEHFESCLLRLQNMGIEVDLILFHPYDRWGFSNLSMEDNLTYLDYVLRRLSAFPGIWWSIANEYDVCANKTVKDWECIEEYIAANDPYGHLLSNHNCFCRWDAGRKHITHVSWQSKQFYRVADMMELYHKPVLFDECRYEGNLPEMWGNLSGQEMTRNFWRVTVQGGYCTHGETFYPGTQKAALATETGEKDVVWWARGGRLNGESPARIAFLREIIHELPGPLEPLTHLLSGVFGKTDEQVRAAKDSVPWFVRGALETLAGMGQRERDHFFSVEYSYIGHIGNDAFLYYLDDQCCAAYTLNLPEEAKYTVDVIDTWEMTRQEVLSGVCGEVKVELPGKPYMAVLAVKTGEAN